MRYAKQIVLVLLATILLVGCGGGNTSTTNTASTPAAPAATPAVKLDPQKPGTLKISFWYGLSGVNGDVLRTLINKYNESQNKYYIDGIFQSSYDDTLSKFNASLSGNQLPNVVQIYDIGTQRMIDTKQIIPVQDLINRDHLQSVVDDLEPAIRNYYTVNGTLYSMPFNSSTMVMYYDKNAFKEVGLDPSQKLWTYDQVIAAAKKLTQKDSSGKVARAGISFYDYSWFFEQALASSNQFLATPNNGRTGRATQYSFNNDAGVKWLEFEKQLIADGSAKYYGASGSSSSSSAFLKGQSAMTFESVASMRNFVNTAAKNGNKLDIGVAYIPRQTLPAQGRTAIGGASLWITNKGTKEQQEGAWDFTKFLSQPDTQAFWSSNTGYIPTRLSAYNQQAMKDTLTKYPQFQVGIDQIRSSQTNYYNAGAATGNMLTMRNNVQTAMDAYLTGQTSSAKTALDSAVQKSNDSLAEYNDANK